MISIRKFVVSSLLRDRQCIVAVLAPVSKRGFAKKRRPEENVPYQISKFHRYLAQKREHELEERKTVKSESFDDLVEDAPEARVEGRGIVKASRLHLTPHQYWVTQGKGNERPFTGDYWFSKDLGHYECTVCETKLFSSDHKFFPPTGMASFWHHIENNVETVDDTGDSKEDNTNLVIGKYAKEEARPKEKQRAICRKCKSHLGLVYLDGPPPTFTRFSINSASLKFVAKEWFDAPQVYKVRRQLTRSKERQDEEQERKRKQEEIVDKEAVPFDKKKYYQILTKDNSPSTKVQTAQNPTSFYEQEIGTQPFVYSG